MNKKILFFITVFLAYASTFSQTTIWSDDFENACTDNCLATTHNGWTEQNNIGGTSGANPNNWFVSCAEDGITPPGCGSSCVGDESLHIGADAGAGGDMGSTFNETGAANATFKRIVSPTISTVGYTNLTLTFHFIAFGSAACADDRAQLQLSTDNGATWPVGFQYCLTSVCCGAYNGYSQGQWTTYSLTLPSSFENNPNVKIGFHWRNNGNGSGTDPSVAIDDITLTSPIILPVTLAAFSAQKESNNIRLKWASAQELNVSHYEILRSTDNANFKAVGKVNSKINTSTSTTYYSFLDKPAEGAKFYYQLKMVDLDGRTQYSNIVSASLDMEDLVLRNLKHSDDFLTFFLTSPNENAVEIEIFGTDGKRVNYIKERKITAGENYIMVRMNNIASGAYILKILTKGDTSPQKIVKTFSWVQE